ncbi:MAG: hypothetical protein HRT35_23420, partial [Algicola sp.]|nr:hypothetical protein [Algicola sp.]
MIQSGFVNILSTRLEKLLAGRANDHKVIDALKQAISNQPNKNVAQFKDFFARAVQHSDIETDYTTTFDQLVQQLDNSAALTKLLKMALYPPEDLNYQLEIIAQQVKAYIEENNIRIPSALGSTTNDFVAKLYQLVGIFIELVEPEVTLNADIKHLKDQLAKPLLPLCALPIKSTINNFFKFKYDRQLITFKPPTELMKGLKTFLIPIRQNIELTEPDIAILTLHGQGGVGKSRVAFELCLAQQSLGWHSGFLYQGQSKDVLKYRWDTPTLLVFDYAAERLAELTALVAGLQACFSQHVLRIPVRILLLERQCSAKTGWFKQLNENAVLAPYLSVSGADSSKAVPSLTDDQLLALAVEFLSISGSLVSKDLAKRVVNKAKQIEKVQPRPLIIQLIAELCLGDEQLTYGSIETLLEALFQREQANLQKLRFGAQVAEQFWQVLAVATLTGGFEHQELKNTCQSQPFKHWYEKHINQEVHSLVNAYLGEDNNEATFWFGLEPDLLGEYLVLRHWRNWQNEVFSLSDNWQDKLQCHLSLAFSLKGKTTDSLVRLCLDFTENNPLLEKNYYLELQLKWLKEQHTQTEAYAEFLALYLSILLIGSYLKNEKQQVLDRWQQLLKCYSLQPILCFAEALASHHLALCDKHLPFDVEQKKKVVNDVLSIAERHNQPAIWLQAAQGITNLLSSISELDNQTSQQYADKLLALAAKHNQPEIWLQAAQGLMNLITRISEQDNQAGQQYADKLLALAAQYEQPAIWLEAAKGLTNLLTGIGEQDNQVGQQYADKLLALAAQH